MSVKALFSPKKIIILSVIVCGVILSLAVWERPSGVSAETKNIYKDLETFANILSIIQKSYVEEVNPQAVVAGAIKGMLDSLDPHSSYMKPDEFKELQVETKGEFTGIGIEITMKEGVLTVVSPIEGTPAFQKGLRAGDKIIKIDNESTKDMSLMAAVKKLRGAKGTQVSISIFREGWTELKEITIVRDVIPIHSVKSDTLEPGYAYLRITNFQAQTDKDLQKALDDLEKQSEIKGLALDLRNNPGGLLDQAVKVSDIFLDDGLIVFTKGRMEEQNMTFKAHANGNKKYTFPIIVLVNEGTASASEIVAGALQDHKRGLVLGAQTFGKGSVQTIIPLDDGSGLRLTTARYYTPNGTSIQAKGITPDILVPSRLAYAQPEKEKGKNSGWILREKDLKRHITNEAEPAEPEGNPLEEPSEENAPAKSIKDALGKDPQLNTALLMLKGLNVFSGPQAKSGK